MRKVFDAFSNLPTTVELGGAEYPINTDFRVSLQFEELVQSELDEVELLARAIDLYYPDEIPPHLLEEAVDKLLEFYRGNKPQEQQKESEPVYAYEQDKDYIYSAFLEQYKVDLYDIPYMHWWKYMAMFTSLDEKCRFMEIVGYRSIKIDSRMSKEQKKFYKTMKNKYKLPRSKRQTEEEDALVQALLAGENLDEVL